jgi:hypothetical protein
MYLKWSDRQMPVRVTGHEPYGDDGQARFDARGVAEALADVLEARGLPRLMPFAAMLVVVLAEDGKASDDVEDAPPWYSEALDAEGRLIDDASAPVDLWKKHDDEVDAQVAKVFGPG